MLIRRMHLRCRMDCRIKSGNDECFPDAVQRETVHR